MVKEHHPEALLLQSQLNLGYAKAINRGLEQCSADFVCLLNSDTEMTRGALASLVGYLKSRKDVGLVGPRLLYPGGQFQSSRRSFPFFQRSVTRLFRDGRNDPPSGSLEADWLVGACVVVPRLLLHTLGGMDENYPFYGEDMDLAYRIQLLGLKVVLLSEACVYHVGEGSSGPHPVVTMRVRSYYEAPLRFLRQHASPGEVLFWRVTRGTAAAVRYGVARVRRGSDSERHSAIWSMVFGLCVRGAPSDWALGPDSPGPLAGGPQ
jgi:GT2 family glycosyltransferase